MSWGAQSREWSPVTALSSHLLAAWCCLISRAGLPGLPDLPQLVTVAGAPPPARSWQGRHPVLGPLTVGTHRPPGLLGLLLSLLLLLLPRLYCDRGGGGGGEEPERPRDGVHHQEHPDTGGRPSDRARLSLTLTVTRWLVVTEASTA